MNRLTLPLLAGVFATIGARAQLFDIPTGDLLLSFSRSGSPDVEVDIGSLSLFTSLAPSATLDLTPKYSPSSQLLGTFGNLNGVSFSVIGAQLGAGGAVPNNTTWFTLKRSDVDIQTTAPFRFTNSKSQSIQAAISGIEGIGSVSGANVYAASIAADPVANTPTVLIVPTTGIPAPNSFTSKYNASGGLKGLVPSPGVLNTAPSDFSSGSQVIRSDLYEYLPGSSTTHAQFLGAFTLDNVGGVTFTAVPEPGTWTLLTALGLGAFGLAVRARRNRAADELSAEDSQPATPITLAL